MLDDEDVPRLLQSLTMVLGEIQDRTEFSKLSEGDRLKDKCVSEAARISAFALRQLADGKIGANAARREISAARQVVNRAKGPILTIEAFALEHERHKRNPSLWP